MVETDSNHLDCLREGLYPLSKPCGAISPLDVSVENTVGVVRQGAATTGAELPRFPGSQPAERIGPPGILRSRPVSVLGGHSPTAASSRSLRLAPPLLFVKSKCVFVWGVIYTHKATSNALEEDMGYKYDSQ